MQLTIEEEMRVGVIRKYKTNQAAAKAIRTSPSHLSQMLNGQRPISDELLEALGWERKVFYIKKGAR
jgi:plasmid maintenance system antidote protein VapI